MAITLERRAVSRPLVPVQRTGRRQIRRPRILYLASNDPRMALTGAAQRVGAFLGFLTERFPVKLLYLEGAGRPPIRRLPPARTFFPKLEHEEMFGFSKSRYFLFSRDVLDAADRHLLNRQTDLIVCDYGVWGIYGALLAHWHGIPFIYSSHNVEWRGCLDKAKGDLRRLPLAAHYYGVERAAVKRADLLITITNEDARWYRRWRGDRKMMVIPQGVDRQSFYPESRPDHDHPPRILFCGNFSVPFNREALDVMARKIIPGVLKVCPDAVFECVGANPPRHSPHPSMVFTGYSDDYPRKLRECDVVVSPVVRGHGFPTKVIEALACGRPTVATPVGARGLTGRMPRHLTVAEPDGFAQAVLVALGRRWEVNRDAAEEIIARYGWNTILDPLEKAIYELCGRRAPV